MSTRILAWCLAVAVSGGALGQAHDPDPEAVEALADLVDAYRQREALTVRTTVTIELSQDGVSSDERQVEAEMILGPRGTGIVKLRGFTCYLADGHLAATHESTDHSYYKIPDDGSPYYALMSQFMEIPFPHLAIAFGEQGLEDLCMQFHQMAPWVAPTGADTVTLDDGRTLGRIMLTSDFDELTVLYDRESMLIDSVDLKITGGDLVQPGATLTYRHDFEYELHEDGLAPETFRLDPGPRQRVDLISALVDMPAAAGGGGGVAAPPGGGGDLVGRPAPGFVLALMDGGAVDLDDLRGEVVVLDFWATWCGPCRMALPLLHEVARWAEQQDVPVRIYTVNVWERGTPDQRLEKAKQYWRQEEFTLPVAMDYTDATAGAYGVSGIPATVIIRPDGTVHARHVGVPPDYVQFMRREIAHAVDAVEPE